MKLTKEEYGRKSLILFLLAAAFCLCFLNWKIFVFTVMMIISFHWDLASKNDIK